MSNLVQLNESNEVQKSRPLSTLYKSDLKLLEFKLIDVYLSKINSHDPTQRRVTFEKGELERLFGVNRLRTCELHAHLYKIMLPLTLRSTQDELHLVTLFEEATCKKDEYGVWQVNLECSQKALKYFFNIDNLGYLRYKLKCIAKLQSRYSYVLFNYLESNRFRKTWKVTFSEFREILGCADDSSYSKYKRFNDKILKRAYAEINEKTPCIFTYSPICSGRTVTHIELSVIVFDEEPVPQNVRKLSESDEGDERITLWQAACNNEFNTAEMNHLAQFLMLIPKTNFLSYASVEDLDLQRYHYLSEKYASMNRISQVRHINNRFSYMLGILKRDAVIEP